MDQDDLRRQEKQSRREMPATKAALDAYRAVLMDNWLKTPIGDVEAREGIYRYIKASNQIEQFLAMSMGMGSEDIEEAAKQFAATAE